MVDLLSFISTDNIPTLLPSFKRIHAATSGYYAFLQLISLKYVLYRSPGIISKKKTSDHKDNRWPGAYFEGGNIHFLPSTVHGLLSNPKSISCVEAEFSLQINWAWQREKNIKVYLITLRIHLLSISAPYFRESPICLLYRP